MLGFRRLFFRKENELLNNIYEVHNAVDRVTFTAQFKENILQVLN